MNIRDAILKAADWIEGHPRHFSFGFIKVPDCGSPGCAIGWIDHFLNIPAGALINGGCDPWVYENRSTLGVCDEKFYIRMDKTGIINWRAYAKECAEALRLYADKYHPAEPSKELPSGADVCRAIISKPFRETAEV
jgi:hypothetical protein